MVELIALVDICFDGFLIGLQAAAAYKKHIPACLTVYYVYFYRKTVS